MLTSRKILLRITIPFALGYFLSYVFRTVNAVLAPKLIGELQLTSASLGLLTSAYFLSFALFQLPLGVLLDRYGPRRVEAALLVVAATGTLVFALAQSLVGLVVGRALIGLGVSACLMAAFKAFVLWYPAARLPLVNGVQMAAGGLGALCATLPVQAALEILDWRQLFLLLGLATLAVAALLFKLVPEAAAEGTSPPLREQLRGLGQIFSNRQFWSIAPWTIASQAAFLSIQGLWSGPWLRDVAGLDQPASARMLLLISSAMVAGFLLSGWIAERLSRRGISTMAVAAGGMLGFMLMQLLVILQGTVFPRAIWGLWGFFGTTGILPYAALSQRFPKQLAGRVNTGLNLMVFLCAFAAQWGIGVVISLWPVSRPGHYAEAGYQAGFGLMLALQLLGLGWFLTAGRRGRATPV
jgi:predicted MFS family arabinose efflux permease